MQYITVMAEHSGALNGGQISAAVNQHGWVGVKGRKVGDMHGSLSEPRDSVSALELYPI